MQPGDKNFKSCQPDQRKERQHRPRHGNTARAGDHHGQTGENLQHGVTGQHVGKKTNRQADRADEVRNHFNDNQKRDQRLGCARRHKEREEMHAMLNERHKRNADKDNGGHHEGDNDLAGKRVGIGDQPQHVPEQQKDEERKDKGKIRAAFAAGVAAHHVGYKLIEHFG